MRTVIRVFGTYESVAIPSAWSAWTFQGVAYARVPDGDRGDVIICTVDDRRFVWADDGTRWGWVAVDAPGFVSRAPTTDAVIHAHR